MIPRIRDVVVVDEDVEDVGVEESDTILDPETPKKVLHVAADAVEAVVEADVAEPDTTAVVRKLLATQMEENAEDADVAEDVDAEDAVVVVVEDRVDKVTLRFLTSNS